MNRKIILAGGSGFIGSALARRFRERGCEVVVLTRSSPRRRGDGIREVQWNVDAPIEAAPWAKECEGAHAVINLAGASINCVHHEENRRRIRDSRLAAVRALGAALRSCAQPPAVWVQGSAVGIYGNGPGRCDEATPPGSGFLAHVCCDWEAALAAECPAGVRAVVLRIGVVLGRRGGAFPPLARLTKWFLGGAAGSGHQGMSWIGLHDLEEIFLRAVENDPMRGTYNACAPEPVSNAEFMRTLRDVVNRPWCPPAPSPVVRAIALVFLQTEPSLVLEGQYAFPSRLEAEGFRFTAPRLVTALTALAD
ncbi:MAG: TIGR01777 family oxidoreductase [Candidatus Didemnitutus sp.]|nr:TIGR01777 family oxidoreductase [Candidatus Didemnitutus sp.]